MESCPSSFPAQKPQVTMEEEETCPIRTEEQAESWILLESCRVDEALPKRTKRLLHNGRQSIGSQVAALGFTLLS
jgi:hypothetical protein